VRLSNPVTTGLIALAAALALGGVIIPAQSRNKSKTQTPPVVPTQSSAKTAAVTDEATANPELAGKLVSLLPAGMTMARASSGFRSVGQFVTAVHLAHNLGIQFDQLKARVTTGRGLPLGQAVADLKPLVHADSEVAKAERQAKDDLNQR